MYNYANSLVYTDDLLLLIVKIKQTKLSCVSFAKKYIYKNTPNSNFLLEWVYTAVCSSNTSS